MYLNIVLFLTTIFSLSFVLALPSHKQPGSSAVLLMTKPDPKNPDDSLVSMLPLTRPVNRPANKPVKPVTNTILPYPNPDKPNNHQPENNIKVPPQLNKDENNRLFFNTNSTNSSSLGFTNLFSLFG